MAPYLRYVSDYPALIEALRDRFDELEMTRAEIDAIARLQPGYAGKVLTRSMMKSLGMRSLGPVMETAGLIMVLLEDPVRTERTLRIRAPRRRPIRPSPALQLEAPHAESV
jgi:hypothetical protein